MFSKDGRTGRAAIACLFMLMSSAALRAQTNMPEQVLGTDAHSASSPQTPPLQVNSGPHPGTAETASAAPEYLLRSGDTITVSYRFTPEFDDTAVVAPDGRLTLKNLPAVAVAGATLPEVKARVLQAAMSQLRDPEITVALKNFQQSRVVVGGEVRAPGSFDLRGPTTVLQAILMAGGPKQDSAMGHVLLFRRLNTETAETHVLRLNHLTRNHIPDDILLQPDDMILVRHDGLSSLERYMKVVNLGVFFNPFGTNGIY